MKKNNLLIAEDHVAARRGIIQLLEQNEMLSTIYEAENGKEAVKICLKNPVDIVLMDFSMPEMNGYDAAKQILSKQKHIKIIVMTQYDEIAIILNFFKIGARGFLTKMADESEINYAIRSVSNGDYYYHSRFDEQIKEWLKEGLDQNIPSIRFSEREIQITTLMSRGFTSAAIAKKLGIKPRTVETYRYDLIKKAKVHNASELIGYVYRNGLI